MIYPTTEIDDFDRKFDPDLADSSPTLANTDLNEVEPPPVYSPPAPSATPVLNTGLKKDPSKESFIPSMPVFTPGQATETASASPPMVSEDIGIGSLPKGTNFVSQHVYFDNICASYSIDPNACDPSQILLADRTSTNAIAKEESQKTRKNLSLQTECGAIEADVRVLNLPGMQVTTIAGERTQRKVSLNFRTMFGSIDVKVHLASCPPLMGVHRGSLTAPMRLPVNISASSQCGSIHVSLPLSFTGYILVGAGLGQVLFSPKVKNNVSWDSQLHGTVRPTRTVVVGDVEALKAQIGVEGGSMDTHRYDHMNGQTSWEGDEVHLNAWCGSVFVDYADEVIRVGV
ncbi:hypothetical protein C8R42DRAFT_652249 [Lentinula raphanica]|nr:hypothetical protein C8R42DRAFT_652249 [Lentinula raphanica]